MNTQRQLTASLALAICLAGIPLGMAQAVPPHRGTTGQQLQSASLRDASTDVVLSDGGGAYSAAELESLTISTTNNDRLFVKTSPAEGARTMEFSSDLAALDSLATGAGSTLECLSTHILFESASTPDWFGAVASVGDSVRGWGNVRCYTSEHAGYQVFYQSEPAPSAECLTLTRESATKLVLAAESGPNAPGGKVPCVGNVQAFEYTTDENGERTGFTARTVGAESAPYELTLTFGTVEKQKGKPVKI